MNKKIIMIVLTLFFFLSATSAMAQNEITSIDSTEIETYTDPGYGPGSKIPVQTPMESGYVWITSVEPMTARWIIYAPGFKEVTTIEQPISYKSKIQEGEHEGKWACRDENAWTVPAFAEVGTWIVVSEIELADGSVIKGVSAENPETTGIGYEITNSGDVFTNLFGAPWYLVGMAMPPVFWFPLIIVWGPALFVGLCFISPHISETLKRAIDKIQEARKKW